MDGKQAAALKLENMIYQGTVWGPWLWNFFDEDAQVALHKYHFTEIVFADDLNAFREFDLHVPSDSPTTAARMCQGELHASGRPNQVAFDPKKEAIHVVSHCCPKGPAFRILGVQFDCWLTMCDAVGEPASELRWRLRAILRTNRYYSVAGMVQLYKAKV